MDNYGAKKQKRVSFSEYKPSTVEEMQQFRMQKQSEFFRFLEMKQKANEEFMNQVYKH
jgi:predicted transcriptional regulator